MAELKEQSNPFSTGGGGVNFESRVQASFLVALLAGTPIPCMPTNARVKEISFQNRYAGVHTDDLLVISEDSTNNKRNLRIQIKHEITISDSEESVFAEVILAAWEDFNSQGFNKNLDSIALVTGPLTKVDLSSTIPILEWARHSSSSDEFIKKATTKGFTSAKKKERLSAFRAQLIRASGDALSDNEFWEFLKAFHLISYDFDQVASVTAAMLGSLIRQHSDLPPSAVLAQIVTTAQEFNQNAGTLTVDNIPADLSSLFRARVTQSLEADIDKLRERSRHIYLGISNSICGSHVSREDIVEEIRDSYEEGGFVFVTGERGAGKSGVVKDYVQSRDSSAATFYVRAEDFDKPHLNDVFVSMGISSDLHQLASHFSLLKEKILIIESIEKVLELNNSAAFIDLLNFIRLQGGWCVIATGRDYAYQQLAFNYLQPCGLKFKSVKVSGFTDGQVEEICNNVPELRQLTGNPAISELLHNPFFIDLAVRALANGAKFESGNTEGDFRTIVWNSVIERQSDRRNGMPARRRATFIEVAKLRAKRMVFGVPDTGFDPAVVAKLEEDNLIRRDARSSLISPSHDVLEDWALGEFIENEYLENLGAPNNFLAAIGSEPAIGRGLRLWMGFKLAAEAELTDLIESILTADDISSHWKDEVVATVLLSPDPSRFFNLLQDKLLANQCILLIRFSFILRIACQRPVEGAGGYPDKNSDSGFLLLLKPYGRGWEALINFIFSNRASLSESVLPHVVEVAHSWSDIISIWSKLPAEAPAVGGICLFLLEWVDSYKREKLRTKVLKVLLKVVPAIPEEFNALAERNVFASRLRRDRPNYVEELVRLALASDLAPMLCRHRPDFIMRLARHEWLQPETDDDNQGGYRPLSAMGLDEAYGLQNERDYFPASGLRGPFKYLLQHHPRKGLDFILDLCRVCSAKFAASEYGQNREDLLQEMPDEMEVRSVLIRANDGTQISHFASPHLWKGYRGHSTVPYLLQCALMALENWLVEYVENPPPKNELSWIYEYILKSSNSVLTTAVLASIAVGFPKQVGSAAYPLLKCTNLYTLDLIRQLEERGSQELNWFAMRFDPWSEFFAEERKNSALKPWRGESLEALLVKFQFIEEDRSAAYEIIDELSTLAEAGESTSLKFLVHRVDTRSWEAVPDEENNRIIFQSTQALSEDLQQAQREHQEIHAHDFSVQRLYLWSRKKFENNETSSSELIGVDEAIADARKILDLLIKGEVGRFEIMALGAVATTAAVAVRDYFDTLSVEDVNWCLEVITQVIHLNSDDISGHMAVDATDSNGAAACAYVLAKLLELELDPEPREEIYYAIATAITHVNIHVCASAAKGVRDYLWNMDESFASSCISGALEFARFELASRYTSVRAVPNSDPDTPPSEWSTLVSEFREKILGAEFEFSPSEITPESHSLWRIHIPMLMLPLGNYDDNSLSLLYKTVSIVYEEENEHKNRSSNRSFRLNHDVAVVIQNCLAEHVIASKSDNFRPVRDLLLAGCQQAPSFIYLVKLRFDTAMEQRSDYKGMWELWCLLESQLHEIALNAVYTPYSGHQHDLNTFLRGMLYSDGVYQKHPNRVKAITTGSQYLLEFCRRSACNSLVFESLCSLMYQFHDLFFDDGIHVLAAEYRKNSSILTSQGNSAYCLEMAIAKFFKLTDKLSLKMYEACLDLLTGIVETGSARAYYLRESLIRTRRIYS
ncbi:hypothetical protein [Pseudomonas sp. ATCC 13867]|uniref:hypothetical protein n=1 Tax=Pseudomonas sp. ATCC 13867 TaxID=1294143 RepID=UPI000345FC6F|nr:hypothetical protein [Pseudomonas sp. ATCC 13867]